MLWRTSLLPSQKGCTGCFEIFWSEGFPRVEAVACTDSLGISRFGTPGQISRKRLGAWDAIGRILAKLFFL